MSLDLRTGQPVWLIDEKETRAHSPLREAISVDTVIVGGGVAGALIAYALTDRGMRVALVDAREVAAGSTSASTAILSYETDTNLSELIQNIGEKNAVRIFQAGIEAIDHIESILKRLDDDCDFKRRNSVYFASSEDDAEKMKEEYTARKKHGFDLEFLSRQAFKKLFPFDAPCALLSPNIAVVNPIKLTRALIRASEKNGLQVFAQTKITKYNADASAPSAVTENGQIIRAKQFVFATGYETEQFLKQKSVQLQSSYAIASEPVDDLAGLYEKSTLWESARPYVYIRTTADNRIIIGGEDVDFADEEKRDALLAAKTEILQHRFQTLFPHIPFKLASAWTGTFAESDDSLPYIGAHKDFPGAYFSLGYGGNGTTFAAMASKIIPDLIMGKENPDAQIFGFDR